MLEDALRTLETHKRWQDNPLVAYCPKRVGDLERAIGRAVLYKKFEEMDSLEGKATPKSAPKEQVHTNYQSGPLSYG